MRGRTRITLDRDTLKSIVTEYLSTSLMSPFELKDMTIHRNGSIECVLAPVAPVVEDQHESQALPLDSDPEL